MKTILVKPFPLRSSSSLAGELASTKARQKNEQLVAGNKRIAGVSIESVSWGESRVVFKLDNGDELSVDAHDDGIRWTLKAASDESASPEASSKESLHNDDRELGLQYVNTDMGVYMWKRAKLLEERVGKPLKRLFDSSGLFLYVDSMKPLWFTGLWIVKDLDDAQPRVALNWDIPE